MKAFVYLLVLVSLIFVGGLACTLAFGYEVAVLKGESMSPTLNEGDLIITSNFQGKIKPGMIVIYNQGSEVIIHRVVLIEDGQLRTKGDAQGYFDQWLVPISGVKGAYLFKIPRLGHLASFIRTPFYQVSISMFFIVLFVVYERKKKIIEGGGK